MSGSDKDVQINIGADTAKYNDAVDSAAESSRQLAASVVSVTNVVASGRTTFLRAGQPVEALAAALLKAGASADEVNKYLGFTAVAAGRLSTAAQAATSAGQSFGSLAVPAEAAAAATARLEAAIARLMSGVTTLPSAAGSASSAVATVSSAATQGAAQISADADATLRLDAATRQILSTLSPAATAMMRAASAATGTAQSLDADAAATARLDAATRSILGGLSPAALAMLRLKDAATQTAGAISASAAASAEAAGGMASVSSATTAAASASEVATNQMMGNSRQAAAMARLAARASFDAAVATASSTEPLQRLGESYATAAAQALRAGSTAKDVAKSFDLPVQAVQRFAGALQKAMEEQRAANAVTGETTAVNQEMSGSLQAAARLEEAIAKTMGDLASATRAANAATKEAGAATENFGSANQRAGEKITSAGNKYYSAGQDVTALYHALIEAGDSAEAAAKKLGVVSDQAGKAGDSSKTSGLAMSGLSRELIVLGHEAISGNWTRIPGSLLVLTEYTGNARAAIANFVASFGPLGMAAGVAATAVVAGLGLMIERAYEAKRALDEVTAAAALMGRSTVEAANSAKVIRESLQDAGMGRSDIDKVNAAVARTPGLTDETRRAFGALAPAMQAAFPGEEVDKYFTPLMHAAGAGANAVKGYLEQIDGLNTSNIKALDTAGAQNDKEAASLILLTAMRARLSAYNTELERRKQILADVNVPGLDAPPLTMGMLPRIRLPQSTQPEAAAESPETIRQAEAQEKLLAPMRERAALQRDINDLQTAIAKGGDADDLANQQEALKIARAKLQLLRDAGDSTWAAKQQSALNDILTGLAAHATSAKQLAQDENMARISFWSQAAKEANLSESEINLARDRATRARLALAGEELRALDAGQRTYVQDQQVALGKVLADATANATSRKQLALEETRARIGFWDEQAEKAGLNERQIAAAQIEAGNARRKLAKQELAENEAGAATWVAKQQEALSEILVGVAAHAKTSRGLAEDENRARIAFWDDAAKHSASNEKEVLAAQAAANHARLELAGEEMRGGEAAAKQALGAKLSALSAEQAAKRDDFAKVMELEDQKIALLTAAGASETKQLNEELKAQINMRRQHTLQVIAEQERELAYSRGEHTAEISQKRAELDEEVSERRMSKAQEMGLLRAFADEKHALDLQALDQLLATIDPQTEAWRKLYADIGKIKQQWVAQDRRLNAEATADLKRQWDTATAPVSQAIDSQVSAMLRGTQTIGQSVAGMVQNIVADYAKMGIKLATNWASSQLMQLALSRSTEVAKTATASSGAAIRGGIAASETAGENAGMLVRLGRWIATQLGMTTSAAAGAAAREGVLTAEQLASVQATGVAARLSIAAAAAVAAAWAFADSAELGPVGLAAAPAAAAGAEATVMAYQLAVPSLDVGAWNVPKDMGANLHAGEMVVPANFASGLRGSINGGKGGDMNLNYSPTVNGGGTDMNSLMRNQAGMIKNYLWHATRNGALRLPGR